MSDFLTPDQRSQIHRLVGVPFVEEGRDRNVGLDCWGLLIEASKVFGQVVHDYRVKVHAPDIHKVVQRDKGEWWVKVGKPTVGCVLSFAIDPEMPDAEQHFGVYVGAGKFIHTLKKSHSIITKLEHDFWVNKLRGIYEWAK